MKTSDYFGLTATIWLASYKPDVFNLAFAGLAFALMMYYKYKKGD